MKKMKKTSNAQFVRDNKPSYWPILLKNNRNKKLTYDEIKRKNSNIPFSIHTFNNIVPEWIKEESKTLKGKISKTLSTQLAENQRISYEFSMRSHFLVLHQSNINISSSLHFISNKYQCSFNVLTF